MNLDRNSLLYLLLYNTDINLIFWIVGLLERDKLNIISSLSNIQQDFIDFARMNQGSSFHLW